MDRLQQIESLRNELPDNWQLDQKEEIFEGRTDVYIDLKVPTPAEIPQAEELVRTQRVSKVYIEADSRLLGL